MELVVLGCSGSVEGPDSAASGYIVRDTITANPDHLLLDCGPGVLSAMQRAEDIDPSACHVAFSHMHADHCLDFPSLLVWRRFHPTAPSTQRHQLFGPTIAHRHLSAAGADAPERPDDFTDTFDINVYKVGEGLFDATTYPAHPIGPFTLYAATAVHPTEAYLLRVEDNAGNSLVYSGDTAWTDNLAHIAAGADVFLCEATWGENAEGQPSGMHISGEDAGRAAQAAGVGKLVLTHIPPWGDADAAVRGAARHYDGEILVARPGMRLTVGG